MEDINNLKTHDININSRSLRIKIIGIGGAGIKTLYRIKNKSALKADTMVIDSDALFLSLLSEPYKVMIGEKGGGALSDVKLGKYYMQGKIKDIRSSMRGYDVVVVTCGLGGGTGSAASVVMKEAKRCGAMVVAVVTCADNRACEAVANNTKWAMQEIKTFADVYTIIPDNYICLETQDAKGDINCSDVDKAVEGTLEGLCSILENEWNRVGFNGERLIAFLKSYGETWVFSAEHEEASVLTEKIKSGWDRSKLLNLAEDKYLKIFVNVLAIDGWDLEKMKGELTDFFKNVWQADMVDENWFVSAKYKAKGTGKAFIFAIGSDAR